MGFGSFLLAVSITFANVAVDTVSGATAKPKYTWNMSGEQTRNSLRHRSNHVDPYELPLQALDNFGNNSDRNCLSGAAASAASVVLWNSVSSLFSLRDRLPSLTWPANMFLC